MAITFNGNGVSGVEFNGSGVNRVTFNEVEVFAAARPTELVFRLTANDLTQTIYFVQSAANAVSVDWGDNSAPSGSADLTAEVSHTYAAAGSYTVKIYCVDGETWTPGQSTSIGLLGTINSSAPITTEFEITFESPCQILISSGQRLRNHTGLTRAVIRAECTTIPVALFQGDSALEEVELPSGVTQIAGNVFFDCTALNKLTVRAETPPTVGINALKNVPADCDIYVPAASVAAYQAESGWSARAEYIHAIVD